MHKILCVSHSSLNAGAERAFLEMVKVLSIAGNSVFCLFPEEGPLVEKCLPFTSGYTIIPMPWWFGGPTSTIGKLKLLRKLLLSSLQIRKYIRKTTVQKIIVNTIAIPGPSIAGRLSTVPVYWFLHELGDDGFHLLFGEKFSKKLIGLMADKVICNSQYILSHYKNFIPSEKLSYAYQSVNIDIPKVKPESSSVVFCLVGRICSQKAQKEAAEAMVFMKDEQALLYLIGNDKNEYADELKNWTDKNGLNEKIVFTGEVQDMSMIYSNMDVLIVCSRNEALGRTTIEAMKCGLPVIAPNAFGHSELIHNGRNGYYYQLGDPSDLAAKMKMLLSSEARSNLGEYGKIWADENFNDQHYAKMMMESLNS